ncbi:hypothetical protein BJF92_21205 [Rhizobium rhizosphaerae]|uniref:Nudix hydrolase domain-containing protein n=1 Tax=Xaviernesmea rhizosphaerae TaxID=1672749 RepID=A0A1Q9ANX8_9HYPH|nr:hypothetical protein [Xaviernesmea rhizosphaerae]OLP57028.1 hypothetical protein BJF92_21205 [Xaviernesmea rhizosphaerae]
MFDDQSFSLPADRLLCHVDGVFALEAMAEAERAARWAAFAGKRPEAFDGRLLRMAQHSVTDDALRITAQETRFSAYIATRDPNFTLRHPGVGRADPLGLTAAVLAVDGQLILTRRNLTAEQNPGCLYLVGGYAEPGSTGTVDLLAEAAREVAEELAVTDLLRDEALAIGLAYDPVHCHPELFLLLPSASRAEDILRQVEEAQDRTEAAQLIACPLAQVIEGGSALSSATWTWSFRKARQFLIDHQRRAGG